MKRWNPAIFSTFRRDSHMKAILWKNSLNYSVGYRAPNARELFSGFC